MIKSKFLKLREGYRKFERFLEDHLVIRYVVIVMGIWLVRSIIPWDIQKDGYLSPAGIFYLSIAGGLVMYVIYKIHRRESILIERFRYSKNRRI